jgi:hypothetical protein
MLVIVLALVSLVAITGTAVLLPGAFGPWSLMVLHFPMAALLAASVLLSYAACVLAHPGQGADCSRCVASPSVRERRLPFAWWGVGEDPASKGLGGKGGREPKNGE